MTDVVLPCRDEAAALPDLLSRMPSGYRPIVVDNGSSDGSADKARACGAEVISVTEPGYGAAVHAGILASAPDDGVVCVMDADGSFDPAQLPLVAAPVLAGTANLGTGRRRPAVRGVWPLHARAANAVLAHRLRRTCGLPVHDIGPMRAFRRDELLALGLRDRRFGYPLELLIAAARAGWRVIEVDVAYHPRAAGTRSKVTGTVLGTARAIRDMSAVLARSPGTPPPDRRRAEPVPASPPLDRRRVEPVPASSPLDRDDVEVPR
ncbi:glycosyltransferase involved in cell wall biosynthesis [Actinoplanes couchii]|uniref:Glycosyl transferase n=1 Tax=Actinoplanes couchii TaxID=403638 RepID=A0ABQ3XE37_9ACTN|nr:glycosyltransferase involved in cell wall biosynthesis [Actinoplanes couchii]GID56753.1 glycosyl transferase [Actinoplanes couchii]